ncbi:MAG TPA: ACT domain-containing protein [Lacunisphaera sp.]
MSLTLQLIPGEFAVCRLPATEPVPAWASSAVFSSVTRTADELSILCPAAQVPADVKHESGWRLLKLQGPFAFTETGILAAVLAPLAAAKIGILATATFDTDYVLVKAGRLDETRHCLEAAGLKFLPAAPE